MSEKHQVVIIPVDSYDVEKVTEAVRSGMKLLGGFERFIRPEESVLLKPNLLCKALPQRAVTTHPAVFEAVIRVLQEDGFGKLSYGDSPGSPGITSEKCADGCGLKEPADRLGVPVADFDHGSTVRFPEGKAAHSFYLTKAVQEADHIVNLCKMKTHALERITGAVKNMYGCILGLNKGAGHVAHPSSESFADMLCDLHKCVKPRLHIMDGITAMEGNGPTSGTPINMNVMLFSADPVALDTVFASLVHLDPATVPTCVAAAREGLGTMDPAQIEVLTTEGPISVAEAVDRWGNPDFDVFRGQMKKHLLNKFAPLLPFLQEKPKVNASKCVACGICEKACPVPEKAVHSGNGQKAVYDYKKCIRCFCCQEMCPAKAIDVHRPLFARLIKRK